LTQVLADAPAPARPPPESAAEDLMSEAARLDAEVAAAEAEAMAFLAGETASRVETKKWETESSVRKMR